MKRKRREGNDNGQREGREEEGKWKEEKGRGGREVESCAVVIFPQKKTLHTHTHTHTHTQRNDWSSWTTKVAGSNRISQTVDECRPCTRASLFTRLCPPSLSAGAITQRASEKLQCPAGGLHGTAASICDRTSRRRLLDRNERPFAGGAMGNGSVRPGAAGRQARRLRWG